MEGPPARVHGVSKAQSTRTTSNATPPVISSPPAFAGGEPTPCALLDWVRGQLPQRRPHAVQPDHVHEPDGRSVSGAHTSAAPRTHEDASQSPPGKRLGHAKGRQLAQVQRRRDRGQTGPRSRRPRHSCSYSS